MAANAMIGASFASALHAGRQEINRRVAEAQRRRPGFDTGRLTAFLQGPCNAVVEAVAEAAPDAATAIVHPILDMAIDLTGHGLSDTAPVQRVWYEVAPAYAHLAAHHPVEVLSLLTNAALHLDKSACADLPRWLGAMARLGGQITSVAQLRALGQLLAWRSGAAHFRIGALQAAGDLPEPIAHAACELADHLQWDEYRAGLLADPWHGIAEEDAQRGVTLGAFTGFGGEFPQPPQLRAGEETLFVRSGERVFELIADRYGATLHGATQEHYDAAARGTRLPAGVTLRGQTLSINGRTIVLDLPENSVMLACSRHTVAACSAYTHTIRVWPLR